MTEDISSIGILMVTFPEVQLLNQDLFFFLIINFPFLM